MGGKDRSNWEPPGPEDPVDPELLKDHANIIKTCHSCGTAVWDYSATGQPVISRTKFEGPPGNREPVQGFFICQTCPPPTVLGRDGKPRPKLGRKGEPIPYRKAWCVKCLKFCIPGVLPSTFAFSDAFTDRNGSWAQEPLPCWHCSTSPTNACHSTCPRNPLLDARALKRPSETVLKPRPSKRSSPPPAPALSAADDVIRRETLAAAVKEKMLYTPRPAAFTFFLPDFKVQKDGTIQLVEPNLDKRQFPKLVSLGCATTTNGSGELRCNICSDPDCLHVSILKRLVDVGRCDPPKSTRELFQPKSSPLQLSKAGFRCPGADFWAVLKDKHWVLCGQKEDGSWVCQQSRCKNEGEAKCAHVCAVTKDTYTPPGLTRRYTRDPEIEWQDIPAESPPPVKSEPKSVTVCDLCRPQHADGIRTDEFHGCSHPGRTVHMCTKACAAFPCSPIPKSQLSDEGGPVNLLLQGTMQERSATGYFSESPPTCKEAPCGARWLRGTEEASFYTEADSSKVDLCVWRCAGKCCYLQPSFEEIYFQAPSPLRVSHKVLKEETKLIYKGTTFKLIAERGEDVGVLRPGREPPLKKDALCTWFQKYLRTELANAPLPELRQPPGPNEWTPALRELLRERPVLPLEPADPQSLIGRTFWKLYPELHQWWRGRVTGHYVLQTKTRKGETKEELFPMYKVEYPGYKECKNKYEEMTWRDLRNRLNPPEEAEGPDFWKPRPRDSPPPPGWYDEPLPPPPPPANLLNHHQKPWATCPTCQDHPEAIYIDCREAHMKRIYRDPHTGAVVNVLPITYPFPNRVVTTDVNPDGSECCCHTTAKPRNNSSIAGAPKVVAGAQMQGLRGLLTRWSGHIPVKEKYDKGQLVPIPIDDAKPAPLTTDERQKLRGLPPCVYTLVEYVDKSNKATCPNPAFTPLFYHLGYLHSDMSLLRHGAQETIVQLLATLKLSGGAPHIEIDCEWDQTLHTYAPLLQGVLFSGKGGDQRFKGFHRTEGIQGQRRRGTGYKVESALLYALAPLLQHLLRLSFHGTDYIACHEASARLCEALGVGRGEIWLGCLPENRAAKRAGEAVDPARVWDLVSTIRDLMAGPCRATSDGVLASDAYVANQHRLSSSNVYHKVYRDVPQYAGKDEADGRCVGGEKCDKCNQEMPGGGLLPDEADREVKEKGGKGSKGGKKAKVQKPEKDDTNGVMVVTCKHRFVYYFHVLLRHESLRDVFTFLCTRFEHRPPRYCIYDNACELSRYCEGRWPEFFARTMFLTDIFHGINHKCSDEFKYHAHRLDQGREFQGLRNTPVSEQINSLMKRFDRTGAASTITNGILLYEYFAYKYNADLRNKWLQAQRQQGHIVNGG